MQAIRTSTASSSIDHQRNDHIREREREREAQARCVAAAYCAGGLLRGLFLALMSRTCGLPLTATASSSDFVRVLFSSSSLFRFALFSLSFRPLFRPDNVQVAAGFIVLEYASFSGVIWKLIARWSFNAKNFFFHELYLKLYFLCIFYETDLHGR